MRTDLPIDKLEAVPSIGDLLAERRGEFGKEVAMFTRSSFGIQVQMGDIARQQCALFRVERSNVALGMLDLARDTKKLSRRAFACNGGVDLVVIVKQPLQRLGIAAAISLVRASHQQREVLQLGVVACEVRVDALGDVAEQGLEAGRRVKLFGFVGLTECSIVGLLCLPASLFGAAASGVRIIEVDLAFSDARFEIVKLGIENPDLAEITAFECLQLRANLRKLGLTLGKRSANRSKLLALVDERGGVRALLKDNFD